MGRDLVQLDPLVDDDEFDPPLRMAQPFDRLADLAGVADMLDGDVFPAGLGLEQGHALLHRRGEEGAAAAAVTVERQGVDMGRQDRTLHPFGDVDGIVHDRFGHVAVPGDDQDVGGLRELHSGAVADVAY